jgi:hypothetical protein
MIAVRLCAPLVLLATVAAAQQPNRPPRDVGGPQRAPLADAVLAGRVTDAESGAPIRRAEVVALNPERMDPRTVLTDDQGYFELAGLEAGRWQVTASKVGYWNQQLGQRRPFEPAQLLDLANGARGRGDFALLRAGAIGGRIYDEFGEPLAAVRVHVMRSRVLRKRRYLERIGDGDQTDDTGAFRIYGLPPGEYYVSASLRVEPVESVVETTYSPTYYPGTASVAEAQRIVITAGTDVLVDFPVLPFRTARVTGVVLDSSGAPADAFLNMSSDAGELGVPLGFGGTTQADGTFTLPDIPPGSYTLIASLKGDSSAEEAASIPIALYGDDVSGLTIVTARPATMLGTIVTDAGVSNRPPADVSIVTRSVRPNGDATFAEPERNTFELTVPSGPFRFDIEPPDGWSVKAIVVRGTDVSDTTLDLKGEQNVPVRVVLTNRLSEVSGTVALESATRVPSVIVFPYDSAKWEPPSRFVRSVAADERGRFNIAGLPAGSRYLVAAVEALEDGEGDDPEFLARIRDLAIAFDLADGERIVVNPQVLRR